MSGSLLRRFILALVLSSSLFGCSRSAGRRVLAEILGSSEVSTDGGGTGHSAIGSGQHIITRGTEETIIRLVPGVLVRVSDQADLVVDDCRLNKDGNDTDDTMQARSARCTLLKGSALVSLTSESNELQFVMGLPAERSLLASSQALFSVWQRESELRITCVRGVVALRLPGGIPPVRIGGGYFYESTAANGAQVAHPRIALASAAAQEEIRKSLAAETIMQRVSVSERNGFLLSGKRD